MITTPVQSVLMCSCKGQGSQTGLSEHEMGYCNETPALYWLLKAEVLCCFIWMLGHRNVCADSFSNFFGPVCFQLQRLVKNTEEKMTSTCFLMPCSIYWHICVLLSNISTLLEVFPLTHCTSVERHCHTVLVWSITHMPPFCLLGNLFFPHTVDFKWRVFILSLHVHFTFVIVLLLLYLWT